MTDERKGPVQAPSSATVRIVSTVRVSNAPINAAASSSQDQTVLVMQDDRTRYRRIDQGDD